MILSILQGFLGIEWCEMIQSFEIERFRCFKRLEVSGLRRVNLIVGPNGTGKTALLEALYLLCSSGPEAYFKTRLWRGIGPMVGTSPQRQPYEALFRNLFYGFDVHSVASIRFNDIERGERSVRIAFEPTGGPSVSLPLGRKEGVFESAVAIPITFHWKSNNREYDTTVDVTSDSIRMTSFTDTYPGAFVSTVSLAVAADNVARFSEMSKRQRLQPIIEALQVSFPQVQDVSVEFDSGIPMLFAGVRSLTEKIPVVLLSAGISKLLTILLAIAECRDGAVFVDEVENGLYYDVLPGMMRSVLNLSCSGRTQIFASTHSMEFLRSLIPLIRDSPKEFCLMRTEQANGFVTASKFEGDRLLSALEQGFDVR